MQYYFFFRVLYGYILFKEVEEDEPHCSEMGEHNIFLYRRVYFIEGITAASALRSIDRIRMEGVAAARVVEFNDYRRHCALDEGELKS